MKRIYLADLNEAEKFKLKVMDAYQSMNPKNTRYLCKLFGIGKSTFYRWKKAYNPGKLQSLKFKSRRPKKLQEIPWSTVVEICQWKRDNPKKSHYYLYQLWISEGRTPLCSPKTIYNWWRKRDLISSRHTRKRRKTKLFNHASVPGELVQVDTKFLEGRKRYQYTAIDVVSKYRVLKAYAKLNQESSIDFINLVITKFKAKWINIKLIQTDNGLEFQSIFTSYLKSIGISHQHIWIHTPDQNGVVERSHRTDEEEFYQMTETRDLTLEELNQKIEEWTEYYNSKRLHFPLNFVTPEKYLVSHI